MSDHLAYDCPFCGILDGSEPGNVLARDDERRFAMIENIHPEGTVHWMAVPFEHIESIELFQNHEPERFLDLVQFAIRETKARRAEYPLLVGGYTVKLHFGAYETVPHAKLHILSVE